MAASGQTPQLQLLAHQTLRTASDSTPQSRTLRLLRVIRTITGEQRTGVWRLAASQRHLGDVVVDGGRICYVTLFDIATPTLGDLIGVRYPARTAAVRRVLAEAQASKQLLGEALLKSRVMSISELRFSLRDQLGLRLAALSRVEERLEAKWCPLDGNFDPALTFESGDAYMAGVDRLQVPSARLAPRIVNECQPLCDAAAVFGASAVPGEPPTPLSIAGSLTNAPVDDAIELAALAQRVYRVPAGPASKGQPRIANAASAKAHWVFVQRDAVIAAFSCRDVPSRAQVTTRVSALLLQQNA